MSKSAAEEQPQCPCWNLPPTVLKVDAEAEVVTIDRPQALTFRCLRCSRKMPGQYVPSDYTLGGKRVGTGHRGFILRDPGVRTRS